MCYNQRGPMEIHHEVRPPLVFQEGRHLEDMVENSFTHEENHSNEDVQCHKESKEDKSTLLGSS
eukprot:c36711_g1_i1 orf=381-572(+)